MKKLFGNRSRKIEDPTLQSWINWFSADTSNRAANLASFPELQSLFSKLSEEKYTKQEIYKQNDLSDEDHLVNLFHLNEPPGFTENIILNKICDNLMAINQNEKAQIVVLPFVFQFTIRYSRIFPQYFMDIQKRFDQSLYEKIQVSITLFEILFSLPPQLTQQVIQYIVIVLGLITDYLKSKIRSSTSTNEIMKFISDIIRKCISFSNNNTQPRPYFDSFYILYVTYYGYWTNKFTGISDESDIGVHIENLIFISTIMNVIDGDYAKKNVAKIVTPYLFAGFNMLCFSYMYKLPLSSIYQLGIHFIEFINHAAHISVDLSAIIFKHQMLNFIMFFTAWAIDRFPMIKFELTTKYNEDELTLIKDDYLKSFTKTEFPNYTFIEKQTFLENLKASDNQEIVDIDTFDKEYHFNKVNDIISTNNDLFTLLDALRQISSCTNATQFLTVFINELFFLMSDIMYKKSDKFNSEPNVLVSSLLYYSIQLFLSCDSVTIGNAFREKKAIPLFFKTIVFQPEKVLWTNPDNEDLRFYKTIRHSLYQLLAQIFIKADEIAFDILDSIGVLLENGTPQMIDEAVQFLEIIYRANPPNFIIKLSSSKLINIMVSYQIKLQTIHLAFLNDQSKSKYVPNILNSRNLQLHFLDLLLSYLESRSYIFTEPSFISMITHFLFEPALQDFAVVQIQRGFMRNPGDNYEEIFKQTLDLLKLSIQHVDEEKWVKLIEKILDIMPKCMWENREALYPYIEKFHLMEELAETITITTKDEDKLNIVNMLLKTYIPISSNNVNYRKKVTVPLKIIQSNVMGLNIKNDTIDLILELIFEQPISIDSFPKLAEIRNQKVLPFLHEVTKHLPQHHKIFDFLGKICYPSVTNKLKVFRSKMLLTILEYIQSFKSNKACTTDEQLSINTVLTLFAYVSCFVFQWKTFFASFVSMRKIEDKYRPWWTSHLVSCFTNILSQISHESPSSFFHFGGRKSGLDLPTIDCNHLKNGFSFIIRFELGAILAAREVDPCLLSFYTTDKQEFILYFDRSARTLNCKYSKDDKSPPFIVKTQKEFGPNSWFHLVVTVDKNNLVFYMNGSKFNTTPLKKPIKLLKTIVNSHIANDQNGSASLLFNMSCAYLFGSCLSAETVALMSKLPMDFVYSFATSSASLFPEMPQECQQLFNDNNTSNLVFCYNARMTVQNSCANISGNDVGNAIVSAHIIPFSTTFLDVTSNIGGLKTFLPLFEQIDMPIYNDSTSDSNIFLNSLMGLVVQFCRSNETIESDFVNCEGLKCLGYLLSKINKTTFQKSVVNILSDLFNCLKSNVFKVKMLNDIWLNFNFWKRQNPDHQIYMINNFLTNALNDQHTRSLILEATSVSKLLSDIVDEKNASIRTALWEFLFKLMKYKFTQKDKINLLSLSISLSFGDLQLEVLSRCHMLFEDVSLEYYKIVEDYGFYTEFVFLFAASDEEIRKFALKYILSLYRHQKEKRIQVSPEDFDIALLHGLHCFNPGKGTLSFWNQCTSLYFDYVEYQSGMFPFLSNLSSYYSPDTIREFLINLDEQIIAFQSPYIDTFLQTPIWYYWLFNFFLQANRPEAQFIDDPQIISIFSKILVTSISQDKTNDLIEVISFFLSVEASNKWDVTPILSLILTSTIDHLIPIIRESFFSFIVTEIFTYLFYIPSTSPFSTNVQLLNLFKVPFNNFLAPSTQGNPTLKMLVDPSVPDDFYVKYSSRNCVNGKWLDQNVVMAICRFIYSGHAHSIEPVINIMDVRVKTVEIFAIILHHLIRSDISKVSESITFISSCIPTSGPNIADFNIAFTIFYRGLKAIQSKTTKYNAEIERFATNYVAHIKPMDVFVDNYITTVGPFMVSITELASNAAKLYKTRAEKIHSIIANRWRHLLCIERSYDIESVFERFHNKMIIEKKRLKSLCKKSYKRIFRDLSSNGGPWCTSESAVHWKLWLITDKHYRHIYMKPNLSFDQHMKASFLRDESSLANAEAKYERWLNAQDIQPAAEQQNEAKEEDSQEVQKNFSFVAEGKLITILKSIDGTFSMNNSVICFDGENKSIQFKLSDLSMVLHRSYLHINSGLEFFLTNEKSYFIFFPKLATRTRILKNLRSASPPHLKILQTSSSKDLFASLGLAEKWKNGEISNYGYLMFLNLFGGRSFNDPSQYPVFPWVISNYTSDKLDLNDPSNYRDLSKPIGALNEKRLQTARENYEMCDPAPTKCMYRMHYSNLFYVTHFLVRLEPFTKLHIEINDQKFDKAGRIFISIKRSWDSVTSMSPDYRELIPEFFTLPDFLVNENKFDLGVDPETKNKNNDVELPPWAKNASEFIQINREALESQYVSQHLNEWVDLIFGYKQTGKEAIAADNTFHQYCYASSVTRDVMRDQETLMGIQIVASNVGIIPNQLFTSQHVKKQVMPIQIRELSTSYSLANLFSLNKSDLKYLHVNGSNIYVLLSDLTFMSVSIPKNFKSSADSITFQQSVLGNINNFFVLQSSASTNNIESKFFAILPDSGRLITSSPWDNSFHAFKLEQGLPHCSSQRQKFSLISSVSNAGGSFVLTSWRDSSISLWDIADEKSIKMGKPVYRITPHLASLVDLDSDIGLNLIASLDKNKNVILSTLNEGLFLRSFEAHEVEEDPTRIILLSSGYIVVASEESTPSHTRSNIRLYGLNTTYLSSYEFDEHITDITSAEYHFGVSGIAVTFQSGRFMFFSAPMMSVLIDVRSKTPLGSISYSIPHHCFFFASSTNIVSYLDL